MPMDSLLMREDIGSFERALLDCQTVERASQIAVNAMQELSGYERVIVYRFEPDNDGVVIAEAVVAGAWTPILGLRYPATDIPRQSRELCLRTALRYAPTRDYPTIPLLSHDLAVDQLDIGAAHVRAQAPIFRNYLQRFNVIGNMSLSLLQDGRLWGLLIAHHRAPHHVTPGVRRRLSALANLLSVRVALLEERAHAQATLLAAERVTKLPLRIDSEQPFPDCMAGRAGLLRDLVDADGVQIWHEGKPFFPAGELGLDGAQQHALYEFLEARTEPLWETDCLSGHFEPAAAYAEHVAGVLAVNIAGPSRTLLALFRGRQPYTVRWGADPSSLPLGGDERPFGWPNRTFQEWQEERTVHAPAWSQLAVETARALGSLIQQIIAAYASYYERLAETLDVQREELQFRALHDTLTGLPNRVALNQALTRIIAKSGEQGCHFSVALLDIDYFKTINDTLGHDCGDLLLQALTTRVQGALPVGGEMARLGGDEFALVLPGGTPESMEAAAREIVECVRDPIEYQGEQFAVTVSLGLVHGDAGSEPGELLKKADLALYRCKDSGRNCSKVYDPSMSEASSQMLRIGRTLNERSADDAVVLHLQPILPIAAVGSVKRFEVLSRWRNLDGSLVPPAEFIPAAQRNGLIRAVTSSVLRKSIELLKRHLDAGGEECLLAVNVSATDLETRRFSRQILEALHTADVPSECLEIEITESVLLQITPTVVESLRILDRGGVRLSLDDFGTGFSSIKYLRELPISTVKIDRQFVSDVTQPDDYNLVRGMIAMAQSIGKEVVAEGVETEAQLEVLRALGCDWGQGYLWARPAPAAKVLDRTGGATTA
jgi:diguanylate cyclase (GGDEF)-like protein